MILNFPGNSGCRLDEDGLEQPSFAAIQRWSSLILLRPLSWLVAIRHDLIEIEFRAKVRRIVRSRRRSCNPTTFGRFSAVACLVIVQIFQGHFVVWRRADNATDFVGQFGLHLLN